MEKAVVEERIGRDLRNLERKKEQNAHKPSRIQPHARCEEANRSPSTFLSKTEISSAAEEEAGGASLFGLGRCLGGMKGGEPTAGHVT